MEQDRVISLAMLARFGRALWRHLWLIGGIVALAVLISYYLESRTPTSYAAESWLLVKTPPYNPQSERVNPFGGSLDSMVNLLASVAIESRVLANPESAKLPAEMRQPGALLGSIDIKADNRADWTAHVFKIAATQPTAADAALLANLWADESTSFLNQYYFADVSGLQKLQAQALDSYNQAQQTYENYLSTSSVTELYAEASAMDKALTDYFEANSGNQAAVYFEQLRARERTLGDQYALLGKLQLAQGNAQALRAAISESQNPQLADSVALASLLTTASSLVPSGTLPVQIQVGGTAAGAPPPSRDDQLRNLDDLLTLLQTQTKSTQAAIDQASQEMLTMQPYTLTATLPPQLDSLIQRDRDLNRQVENANANRKQLEGRRDLYFDSYQDLSKRLIDVTQGLSSFNQVDQIVRADEQRAIQQGITTRPVFSTLLVSAAVMILVVLLYELVAPGRQLARELRHWRPGRRTAPSAR